MKKATVIFCSLLTLALTACSSSWSVKQTSVQKSVEVVETPTPTEEVADVAEIEDEEELENDTDKAETDFVSLKNSSKSQKKEQAAKRKNQKEAQKTIPGKGTYMIKKGKFLSYFKGKKIFERKLEGLREDETKFSLYYDEKDDKMFLMTAVQGPISDFLYVFSDYDNSSEVEYLGEVGCVTTDLIEYLDGEEYKTIIFGKYK